jgi:hypothetical protein
MVIPAPADPSTGVRTRIAAVLLLAAAAVACDRPPTAPTSLVPVLLSPAIGAVLPNGCFDFSREYNWDFDWQGVPGATVYHLYVIGPEVSVPLIEIENRVPSTYRHTSIGWIGRTFGWRWRVRARVDGTFRDWSAWSSFSVEPPDIGCPGGTR